MSERLPHRAASGGGESLTLAAIEMLRLSPERRSALWQIVVEISLRHEAADHFSWDSTVAGRQTSAEVDRLRSTAPERQLVPLGELVPLVTAVGPHVLAVALYSATGWVAGISDWGDGVDILMGVGWEALRRALADFDVDTDIAEAQGRPQFTPGR